MPSRSEVVKRFVPYADSTKHTAAFKVFKYTFLVTMAQVHLQDTNAVERFGYVTSGNPAVDRSVAQSMTQTQLTIAGMAMYLDQGVPFTLVDIRDSVKIYRIIQEHLNDWLSRLSTDVNAVTAPVNDLRKLDALAAEMHRIGGYYMAQEKAPTNRLQSYIEQMVKSRGGVRRNAPKQVADGDQPPPLAIPKHTPMGDSIAEHLRARRKGLNI